MYRLATVFGLASVHSPHRVCRVRHFSTKQRNGKKVTASFFLLVMITEIVRNFALRKSEKRTSPRSTFAIFFGEIALLSCHRQSKKYRQT